MALVLSLVVSASAADDDCYANEAPELRYPADDGYILGNWTGDVGAVADPNNASTKVAMNADYAIVANSEHCTTKVAGGRYNTSKEVP